MKMSQKLIGSAPLVESFLRAIDLPSSRRQYAHRLHDFDLFLKRQYDTHIDSFIDKIKDNSIDLYAVVGEYRIQLKASGIANSTISSRVATTKSFLEYNDVPINNTKFRLKVKSPKRKKRTIGLKALDKELVRKIILVCQDTRIRSYVGLLAATGMRATEALSTRYQDIDWNAATIYLRAEFTKTQEERLVFITQECMKQLKLWKDYRERERRIVRRHKIVNVRRLFEPTDLFFATGRGRKVVNPHNLYNAFAPKFRQILKLNDLAERYDNRGKRHKITFHRFRAFVKSTISDLGHADFSEWYVGHSASTYYRKTEAEKLEIFKKIEPYLTYLDYSKLEAKGADVETKLQVKDQEMQDVRTRLAELTKKLIESGVLKKD